MSARRKNRIPHIRTLRWIMAIVAVLLGLYFHFHESTFEGICVNVLDGDTFRVIRDGREVTVRLADIDCPERSQPHGRESTRFAQDLCEGRQLDIVVQGKDRYNRLLGIVTLPDGRNVSHELVASGNAWWYRHYAENDVILAALEQDARARHLGLWNSPNPQPPWEYRRDMQNR